MRRPPIDHRNRREDSALDLAGWHGGDRAKFRFVERWQGQVFDTPAAVDQTRFRLLEPDQRICCQRFGDGNKNGLLEGTERSNRMRALLRKTTICSHEVAELIRDHPPTLYQCGPRSCGVGRPRPTAHNALPSAIQNPDRMDCSRGQTGQIPYKNYITRNDQNASVSGLRSTHRPPCRQSAMGPPCAPSKRSSRPSARNSLVS
jgi:hypothetical protein